MRSHKTQQSGTPPKNSLFEAGLSFTLVTILPSLIAFFVVFVVQYTAGEGYADTEWYKYMTYLLPQLCIAVACAVYFARSKELRPAVQGCRPRYYLIAVFLQFGLLSLSELNSLFLSWLGKFGYAQSSSTVPDLTGWHLIPVLLVIAVLPAIFEEMLFRGILTRTMREAGWGTAASVLLCGTMFSLFHGSPAQTVYQFACGVCFALIAFRAGSMFPTMISHFLNNALVLCLASAGINDFPTAVKIPLYSVAGVCLVGCLVYLCFFDKGNRQKGGIKSGKQFFLSAWVGIAVCVMLWIATLVEGLTPTTEEVAALIGRLG